MTQYIADKTHFKEVIARVPKAKDALRTGTENIKDLYVEEWLSAAKTAAARNIAPIL